MKFVLFSDLHLDSPFQWAGPSLGRKLRLGLRETLDRICRLAVDQGADALLCAGDLYEQESFTPDTAEYLRSSFEKLTPLRVFIAPGNHDWYGPTALYREVPWSPNVRVFDEGRLTAAPLDGQVTLWGAAHRAPANTDDFLQGFHVDGAAMNLALFHGSEHRFLTEQDEGKVPHAAFREDEIPAAGLRHAFVGHYHQPRNSQWLTYAGSPQPLAFGKSSGSAVIVEVTDGKVHRKRVDVSSVAFHDIRVDVSGATSMSEILQRAHDAVAQLRGVARVTISGRLATGVDLKLDDIRANPAQLDALVIRTKDLIADYDFDALAEEQTVRGQFVRDVRNSELADDETQRVLVVGLRALDGRTDLEPV
ncbi:MAG TPA: metallophosphoesterase [Candidatus Acidoferrum sp.]|jgi:DNA repair exonuclease SbcCD nuclease subunit|nr:metallophosphoesterase [Candidatus Acidoferrum sp.]